MESLELERNAMRVLMRRNLGKPLIEPLYAERHAQNANSGLGIVGALVGVGGVGVDGTTWHKLQNRAGQLFFMPGYHTPGDPCHPIYDPNDPDA